MKSEHIELEALKIEGRNAVLEAFRSGKPIDKLFVLDGCMDGPVRTILREAKKHDTVVNYVERERLDQLSETKKHQGVIAMAAAYEYATVEEILAKAEEKPSTAEMFSRLDSTDYIKPDIEKTVNAVNCGDLNGVLENLGNSFEILWSKSALKEMLSSTHPAACSLSGSGPARFAVYGDLNAALRARDKLSAKGVFCEICKPLNKSLIFE